MATVTVTETIKNNGTPVRGVEVFIDLVAASDDPAAPGYVTGSDYTWADTIRKVTGADGIWSASLEPNANISPANTRYRIRYRFPGSKQRPDPVYIEVLTSPATQRVEDILDDAPGTLATSAVTALTRRLYADRVHRWSCFGHSFHRLGADNYKHLWQNIAAGQLGAALRDYGVSGSDLTDVGETAGGLASTFFYAEPPALAYSAQTYPARPGVSSLISAINAIQAYGTDGDWAQLLIALVHAHRSWCSWQCASAWWQHDISSSGQAFAGSGSWTTGTYLAGLAVGPGTSYRKNSSSGATITVTTSTAMAGKTVALCFLTNRTGGGVEASQMSFTVDGVTTYPTGFTAASPFTTAAINPSSVGASGVAVARFALADDAASHTIVATAGTGGAAYCGWWVETPRPVLVANCARRSDAGYTPNGSDVKVAAFNAALTTMVAEFGTPVLVVDIDSALDATASYFADGLHPNNEGHAVIAAEFIATLDAAILTADERMYI